MFAMALWCAQAGISRQHYTALLEVLELAKNLSQIKNLPRSLATLKKYVTAQLPLLEMRRQKLALTPEKMPTMAQSRTAIGTPHQPIEWLYWFEPISLFTAVLSCPELTTKMHFGIAEFVDKPTELWHSQSWGLLSERALETSLGIWTLNQYLLGIYTVK